MDVRTEVGAVDVKGWRNGERALALSWCDLLRRLLECRPCLDPRRLRLIKTNISAKMTRIPTTTAMVTPTIRPTFRFCFEVPVLAVAGSVGPPAPVALGPGVAVEELPGWVRFEIENDWDKQTLY